MEINRNMIEKLGLGVAGFVILYLLVKIIQHFTK